MYNRPNTLHCVNCERSDYKRQDLGAYTEIEIGWASQSEFEYMIEKIKGHVKLLRVFSPKLTDLTPLESLLEVEYIIVDWNHKTSRLWNISKNVNLKELALRSFRKVIDITDLQTATQIKGLFIGGDEDKKWQINTFEPLANLTNLEILQLWQIRLNDGSFHPLYNLKQLKYINPDMSICSTEEYAKLFAALEHTKSEFSTGVFPHPGLGMIDLIGKGKRMVNATTEKEKAEKFANMFQESVLEYRNLLRK